MKKAETLYGVTKPVKILLSILFLLISLKGLSQKDSVTVNDSVVRISKSVAQRILIAADSIPVLIKETTSLKKELNDYKALVIVRDNQIKVKQDSIRILSGIVTNQEQQKQILLGTISSKNKQLKWSKTKTTISQIALLIVTGVLITKL